MIAGDGREAVALFGSHDWKRKKVIRAQMESLDPERHVLICAGDMTGVDLFVEVLASEMGFIYLVVKSHVFIVPDINKRNSVLAGVADRGIAFWNGRSTRTSDIISRFQALGKRVDVLREDK